jgi:probable rRNA maturation factor
MDAECAPGAAIANRAPRLALDVQFAVASVSLPTPAMLRRWMRTALASDAAVTLRFVGAVEGRRLNRRFRGQDHATNVLTFVYDDSMPLTGDIVLCVPVLRREARAQHKAFADHCAHLVIHGVLHLQGHDHETARAADSMERLEAVLLARLGIADPYALPGGRSPSAAAPRG